MLWNYKSTFVSLSFKIEDNNHGINSSAVILIQDGTQTMDPGRRYTKGSMILHENPGFPQLPGNMDATLTNHKFLLLMNRLSLRDHKGKMTKVLGISLSALQA